MLYCCDSTVAQPELRYQYYKTLECLIGDEILAINGKILQGMSHDEAINEFRAIKNGRVTLKFARREILFNGGLENI